jgi:E3 ubiquitin-protein ligase CCNP1IP1
MRHIDMAIAQDNLQRKNEELLQAYREKSRKYLQTQELYDKLKRRAMLGQVQNAASDVVDNIEASAINNRFVDQTGTGSLEQRSTKPILFPGSHENGIPQARLKGDGIAGSMPPPAGRGGANGRWAAFNSQDINHRMS